jgi:hypothetical protein
VFLAGKSLLLGGSDDFAITDKSRSTIMIEGRYSQNIHIFPVKKILEVVAKLNL